MRQLRSIRRSLSADAVCALVQPFVHYRLDYCNSLLTNVSSQSRMLGLRCTSSCPHHASSHNTPLAFKTVLLVWKCFNSTAPGYLSELLVPVASASGRQHLRSASPCLLQVPRGRTMIRPAELHCRGTVSVEQSSGCSTETTDDTTYFQATTQGLSVPHLMCQQTEEQAPRPDTVVAFLWFWHRIQNCRLTHLFT